MDNQNKLSYSIKELEAASGLSKSSLYALLNSGELAATTVAARR
jgi:predicted DNA-binding transcriptional regulator AlpA